MAPDHLFADSVNFLGGYAGFYCLAQFLMDAGKDFPASRINSISRSDLIVTILYAPKILAMARNTSSISMVPSTSAKTPAFW